MQKKRILATTRKRLILFFILSSLLASKKNVKATTEQQQQQQQQQHHDHDRYYNGVSSGLRGGGSSIAPPIIISSLSHRQQQDDRSMTRRKRIRWTTTTSMATVPNEDEISKETIISSQRHNRSKEQQDQQQQQRSPQEQQQHQQHQEDRISERKRRRTTIATKMTTKATEKMIATNTVQQPQHEDNAELTQYFVKVHNENGRDHVKKVSHEVVKQYTNTDCDHRYCEEHRHLMVVRTNNEGFQLLQQHDDIAHVEKDNPVQGYSLSPKLRSSSSKSSSPLQYHHHHRNRNHNYNNVRNNNKNLHHGQHITTKNDRRRRIATSTTRGQRQQQNNDYRTRTLRERIPYGIPMIQADRLDMGDGSDEISVCVVDSGVALHHPDLNATLITGSDNVRNPQLLRWDHDYSGHGTQVAGIISSITNNQLGVRGVGPIKLHITRALDDNKNGFESDVFDCILQCLANGSKIITLSLGGTELSNHMSFMYDAIVNDYGLMLFSVAGNGNGMMSSTETTPLVYPAAHPAVISVGAVNENRYHAWFSNRNNQVELSAPGTNILSTSVSNTAVFTLPDGYGYPAYRISLLPQYNYNINTNTINDYQANTNDTNNGINDNIENHVNANTNTNNNIANNVQNNANTNINNNSNDDDVEGEIVICDISSSISSSSSTANDDDPNNDNNIPLLITCPDIANKICVFQLETPNDIRHTIDYCQAGGGIGVILFWAPQTNHIHWHFVSSEIPVVAIDTSSGLDFIESIQQRQRLQQQQQQQRLDDNDDENSNNNVVINSATVAGASLVTESNDNTITTTTTAITARIGFSNYRYIITNNSFNHDSSSSYDRQFIYTYSSGTSMACPFAAAGAAKLWSHFINEDGTSSCTNHHIRYAMAKTAYNPLAPYAQSGTATCDSTFGYGIIQLHDAYQYLLHNPCNNTWPETISQGGCTTV